MHEQKNWESLYDALKAMDNASKYLVLRNYEDMSNDNYYMEGHDDIDFLCEDQRKIIRALNARKNVYWGSPDHFIVKIRGKDIKFGLRYIGDGYYNSLWENHMLQNRVMFNSSFYVMCQEDYFYSLLYHALLQKTKLSSDYRERLKVMGEELGIKLCCDADYSECLIDYLKKQGYIVEYPLDATVPIRYENVPKELKGKKIKWKINKILFKPRIILHKLNKLKMGE